jgi:outer membrane protein OmpA-like peptidoglycan-associated protein
MRYQVIARFVVGALTVMIGTSEATDVTLEQVTYPERSEIEIGFSRDPRAPEATLIAEVEYREGQANMNIRFRDMKPAILFGGDVTCYVLWAVVPESAAENLGELWVRNGTDTVEYSTGLKSFAMMVTAEPHPLVSSPSELVMFRSDAAKSKKATSVAFTFSAFAPAPKIEYPSIARVIWDKGQPLDLRQAEKAYEMAVAAGAEDYAPSVLRRAFTALTQARNFTTVKKDKAGVDYSRRSLALSAEAMQVTAQAKEAAAVEAEIARRTAEMDALIARANEAESSAAAASAAFTEAKRQRQEADAAVVTAQRELARIEAERLELQGSVTALQEQAASLAREKEDLSARLQGALSAVADTQSTARGMIVSLPDILFDTDEATLKNDAKVVIAKLAGILLIMPELNLRIEGHTDSTGSPEYNQGLSERRAASVRDFLAEQGIAWQRMMSIGYGLTRPVADNATSEGRAKNRRVEIVIAEGVVAAN